MLYSILIYGDEATIDAWTQQEEAAVLSRHADLRQRLSAQGKLGPAIRLMASTAATTLRCGTKPLIVDGPFSETKEQLLGIYVVECAALEEALEAARSLAFDTGVLEIRPIASFKPGGGAK
jgi:hypothetical protein